MKPEHIDIRDRPAEERQPQEIEERYGFGQMQIPAMPLPLGVQRVTRIADDEYDSAYRRDSPRPLVAEAGGNVVAKAEVAAGLKTRQCLPPGQCRCRVSVNAADVR